MGSFRILESLLELKNLTSCMDCPLWLQKYGPIFRYSVSNATGYVAEVIYEGTPVYPAVSQKLVRPKYENWQNPNKMLSASLKWVS